MEFRPIIFIVIAVLSLLKAYTESERRKKAEKKIKQFYGN